MQNNGVPLPSSPAMFPALLLIPLVALFRIFLAWQPGGTFFSTGMPGACPISAVALCAGLFLPKRLALAVPLGILLLSDVVIDWHYHASFFGSYLLVRYVLLGAVGLLGLSLRQMPGGRGWTAVLVSTVVTSTFFYLVTNTLTWLGSSLYPQNLGGWWQALTVGLPGYAPSYVFYRNGLVSDVLYSMVFVACVRLSVRPRSAARLDQALAGAGHQG